jgi:hypothetical protein
MYTVRGLLCPRPSSYIAPFRVSTSSEYIRLRRLDPRIKRLEHDSKLWSTDLICLLGLEERGNGAVGRLHLATLLLSCSKVLE